MLAVLVHQEVGTANQETLRFSFNPDRRSTIRVPNDFPFSALGERVRFRNTCGIVRATAIQMPHFFFWGRALFRFSLTVPLIVCGAIAMVCAVTFWRTGP
jgi:hypothetical protein